VRGDITRLEPKYLSLTETSDLTLLEAPRATPAGKMAAEVPGDETGDSDRGRRARPAIGQDRFGIPSINDATL
jgi:hypothetical protein